MGELKRLLPMKEMLVDDIVAYSYMPNELRAKGISLAFGLLMASL